MDKLYAIIILCALSNISLGQSKIFTTGGIQIKVSAADSSISEAFFCVGRQPEFPGGMHKAVAFAKSKIHYPPAAVNDNVRGTVVLRFAIDTTGKVIDKAVIQNVRYDLDSACLQMLHKMPKWKPGFLNGTPVKVIEQWKVTFVLTN
ncbi:TonB family C-terminal domain-containing protein [Niabella drilacis]|uniref:TonB family C-terminal domain-containing protein n=1 Tax=Niabella drilacis (strain DSM 25811 / CCM 8410 / CCUG 62505 / LMG 26954 / E90) TaxID=1285928 RepID=A0A1G6YRL2_NIADE|nr:TonB family C-terminal domain-containing protein [Niabella drilacis]